MPEAKYCSPNCQFFKCGQRAFSLRGGKAWCSFADDTCAGYKCNYALCVRGRILVSGLCGLTIKRETGELTQPELEPLPIGKAKAKVMRKLGEEEIF
ncbi:MAG: hypothetical protein QW587_08155 [Candidatus Bathyarchaeia archaeon]